MRYLVIFILSTFLATPVYATNRCIYLKSAKSTIKLCNPQPVPVLAAKPNPEVDPFEGEPTLNLVKVPGIPYLVDKVVEKECLGKSVSSLCPIVW